MLPESKVMNLVVAHHHSRAVVVVIFAFPPQILSSFSAALSTCALVPL